MHWRTTDEQAADGSRGQMIRTAEYATPAGTVKSGASYSARLRSGVPQFVLLSNGAYCDEHKRIDR